MSTKQLANEILKTLLNELQQLARNNYEAGHDSCFSREEVAGLCERAANNLAMIVPVLVLPDAPQPQSIESAIQQTAHYANRFVNRIEDGGESESYRSQMIDAGRGHLVR